MDLKFVALSILVLFLCSGVSSYHMQKREAQEKNPFAQLQEKAQTYWEQVSNTTQGWVESFKALDFTVKARETGERVTEAFSTYANIFYDQAYHWWWPNDQ